MYKAVIFDLDGTLLDTLQDLYSSVNHALQVHNMPQRTLEEIRSFVGNGVRRLIERSVEEGTTEAEIESVLSSFKEHYAIHSRDNTAPYEGIDTLLENLRKRGIKIAVVSNKLDNATKALCREYFGIDVAIGDSEDRARKPAPDSVFEALKQLGVDADEAVYVGDSEVDVLTAYNSGLDCIAVTWGFRSRKVLEECGASVFAEDTSILERLVTGER